LSESQADCFRITGK